MDHLQINVANGKPGPWTYLFSPFNNECNGHDPINLLFTQMDYDAEEWLPYDGAHHDSDEYKVAQSAYYGCLGRNVKITGSPTASPR